MASAPTRRPSEGRAEPILVVDDDVDQRVALAELLSGRGYDVVLAFDGQDAWEMLASGLRPSLIVMDLGMPRMDGWSLLERLRRTLRSAVPVIVTSAAAAARPPVGADACLEKPIEPAQLGELVARLASRAREASLAR